MEKVRRMDLESRVKQAMDAGSGGVVLPVWKKCFFALVAVGVLLVLVEGVLALVGVRAERYASDPYVGFAGRIPLFVEEVDGDGVVRMVTAENRFDYFNRQSFLKVKAEGVKRVFCMGGSTTFGRPYTDGTSFAGWMRELLGEMEPGKWEVVNAGGVSYASYRVALLMEELVRYEPDVFVIYTGHNEFLERRIYGKVEESSGVGRRLRRAAGRMRVTSGMARVLESAGVAGAGGEAEGGRTVLEAEVTTELEKTLGPTSYARAELHRGAVLEHFRFNLGRMVEIAESVGARVIFVEPASNLREVSPFKSEAGAGVSDADREVWQGLFSGAAEAMQVEGDPGRALALLDEAAGLDAARADLHFARGRVLEALGRYGEAKLAYERARDEDVCPLRATSAVLPIVREVAEERGVAWVDYVGMLEGVSEHGIPGGKVFLDHVHPTIESHRMLAMELMRVMWSEGLVGGVPNPVVVRRVTERVMRGVDQREHAQALARLCKVMGWAGKREEAYRVGVQAVELEPDSASIRYEAGLASHLTGRVEEALEHYGRAVALEPGHADAHCNLGNLYEEQGKLAEALEHYRAAVRYGDERDAERDRGNLRRVQLRLGVED